MRTDFRHFLVPFLFSGLSAAAFGADAPQHHPLHGEAAQKMIAALVYGNEMLFDHVFHDTSETVQFTLTDLDVSASDGRQGYEPEDSLFALPSADVEGKLPGHAEPEKFHYAMCLYQLFEKLNVEPDEAMGRTHYRIESLSCKIERNFIDPDKRFSCTYRTAP